MASREPPLISARDFKKKKKNQIIYKKNIMLQHCGSAVNLSLRNIIYLSSTALIF